MDIYLDTCVLNRLTDDQSQPRIHAEALATEQVLDLVVAGDLRWIASTALRVELSRNPDAAKRAEMLPLLDFASTELKPTLEMIKLAIVLETEGFGAFDALHLAVCEQAGIEVLLSVDDRFMRKAARRAAPVATSVLNPIDWLQRRATWLPKP
jgi:predicted nucleic acid-binding protein